MKTKKFLCAERIQRFMISFMLLVILMLLAKGVETAALVLLAFMSIMMAIHGIFDFCPSTFVLTKIFGSCYCECKDEK